MNGILLINKDKNCTSRDVVNEISKILNIKKVGHTGTLDPLATGVLVICVGYATKLVEMLTCEIKEYEALIELGTLTDTLDITGNILKEIPSNINKEQILEVLKNMTTTYHQQVPIYSAVKINGKKLYEYARNKETIQLPTREVTIYNLDLIDDIEYKNNKTYFKIKTKVSKGTYIRSLINDIALKLSTYGTMVELKRTKQGEFKLEDCNTIQDIKNSNYKLINIDKILNRYKNIKVNNILEQKIKNGSILDNIYNEDIIVFKNNNDDIIAIYKKYDKDETKIKPWKMF